MRLVPWSRSQSASPGLVVVLASSLVLASGCSSGPSGSSARIEDTGEYQGLKNLGEMYRIVSTSLKRPPKSINELRAAEAEVPGGFSMLGEPNVAIYFDAELPEVSGKPSGDGAPAILAYERMVPIQGGLVLLLDRSIRQMTPVEFKAAKKAGTKPWTAPAGS